MAIDWHVFENEDAWLHAALGWVGRAEAEALAARGIFRIVLAGGSTPRALYRALAAQAHDWARWQVWFGDERCLPPGHAERNSRMADEELLAHVGIPGTNVQRIPAELGAVLAAQAYAKTLSGIGLFDLVLLGLGEDGHTASLFPGHDWGVAPDSADVLPVVAAPKPPAQRVSLSARRLGRARQVVFLVRGADKRAAMRDWRAGRAIPAASVQASGPVAVLLMRDAVPLD